MAVGRLLPDILDELHWHAAQPADEAAHRDALEVLVEACVIAAAVAKELNYLDLANLAAVRAQEAAAVLGDPVAHGKASFMWLLTQLRAAAWDRSLAAAERSADALEPHATSPAGQETLGMITLTAALSAAVSQRSDRAAHWLDEAERVGAQVPDEPTRTWQSFCPANVTAWRIAVGVECGASAGAVLDLAGRVNLELFEPRSSRRAGIMTDIGRGLARSDTRTSRLS